MLPKGMMMKTVHFGMVTARTSVTPCDDALDHVGNAEVDHDQTGNAGDDEHDTVEIPFGLFLEVRINDIGGDVSSLFQKPGRSEEDYPQQGIFCCLHDPYGRPCEQEAHADGVADSGAYEHEYHACQSSHQL